MSLMFQPLRKYADFNGRARRSEYWLFVLFQVLLIFGFFLAMAAIGAASPDREGPLSALAGALLLLAVAIYLALFIPGLAVTVRRLHDANLSGFWFLISFVPFGGLVVLVMTLLEGTSGPNTYGEDPRVDPATQIVEQFS